jgi:hypothetical protein
MLTQDIEPSRTYISEAYWELHQLYDQNPSITSMEELAPFVGIIEFYPEFRRNNYVKWLYSSRNLQLSIDKLEELYVGKGRPTLKKAKNLEIRNRYKMEREVRFIQRIANILGPSGHREEVVEIADFKESRFLLSDEIKRICIHINRLVPDNLFWQQFTDEDEVYLLRRVVLEKFPIIQKTIENMKFKYPVERNRDNFNSIARQLSDDIADACFRIYGECEPLIVRYVIGEDLYSKTSANFDFRDIIKIRKELKRQRGGKLKPLREYVGSGLRGAWKRDWANAFTLDLPWWGDFLLHEGPDGESSIVE